MLIARLWRYAGSRAGARAGVIALLCVASVALNFAGFRYRSLGDLQVPPLVSGLWSMQAGARLSDEPGVAVLSHPAGGRPSYIVLPFRPGDSAPWLRVTFEAKAEGVVRGDADTRKARLLFWSFDRDWRRLRYVPHEVAELQGTSDWRTYQLIAPVVPATAYMTLVAFNAANAGAIAVRTPRLEVLAESGTYRVLRQALIALWLLAGLWIAVPLIAASLRVPARLPALAGAVCILVGTLTPLPMLSDYTRIAVGGALFAFHAAREAVTPGPRDRIAAAPAGPAAPEHPAETAGASPGARPAETPASPAPPDPRFAATPEVADLHLAGARAIMAAARVANRDLGEPAHFGGFVLFGLAAAFGFAAVPRWQLAGFVVLFGAATEALQSFYFSRDADLVDLLADAGGAALGLALAGLAAAAAMRTGWHPFRRRVV